ncbi:MAG: hypothetical protein ABUK01_05770 [Leptospirales bacterium]
MFFSFTNLLRTLMHVIVRVFLTLFLTLFLSFTIFAQSDGKRSIEMEEEMEDIPGAEESDEQIILIEGEDEQTVRPRKKDADFIQPTRIENLRWIEYQDSVQKKGKSNDKETEKTAHASILYAPLHTLFIDLDIVKSDEYGKYRVIYERENREYIEQDSATVSNSAKESDHIGMSGVFNVSKTYTFLLDLDYKRSSEQLQNNSFYSLFNQDILAGSLGNKFQFNKQNRMLVEVGSRYESIEIQNGISESRIDFSPRVEWDFVNEKRFGMHGALYSFVESPDSGSVIVSWGSEFGLYIPVWNTLVGKKKHQWQGDVYAGATMYYDENRGFIFGPKIRLNSLMGSWFSSLEFFRQTRRLYQSEEYVDLPYHRLSEVNFPSDYWELHWINSFPATEKIEIKTNIGYVYHNYAYETTSQNGIYSLQGAMYSDMFGAVFTRLTLLENLFFEAGVEYHYYSRSVNYLFPYWIPFQIVYEPGRWQFTSEMKIGGSRASDSGNSESVYLLNLSIQRKIDPTISVEIKAQNLLDSDYLGLNPYVSQGRTFSGGIHMYF